MSAELIAAALDYAKRKWPVIPLHNPVATGCSCNRAHCNAIGKHPRTKNGILDATTDCNRIREWWTKYPNANIGIATGGGSELVVVDLDEKGGKHGVQNFYALARSYGVLPNTLKVFTANGEHLYFAHPKDNLKNSTSKIADGVDVRADGGYVVAPPSLHVSGSRYEFADSEQAVIPMPEWLGKSISRGTEEERNMQEQDKNASKDALVINEGKRNDTLFRLACSLRCTQAMEQAEMVNILSEYNHEKCNPPLAEADLVTIAESACKYPPESKGKKSAKRMDQNPLYWFQFNTREWFSNQNLMLMDDAQTGWHIRLKALAWDRGGFLPADLNKLWKLAGAKSQKVFEKSCALVLEEYDRVDKDGEPQLKHPQLAARYADTLELWMKKIEAGQANKEKLAMQRKMEPSVPTPSAQPATVR